MDFYVSNHLQRYFSKDFLLKFKGVDKYKPTSLNQIVGQQTDKSPMKKLIYYLTNWYTWHSTPTTNKRKRAGTIAPSDPSKFKAVLLTGPPGVGKYGIIMIVCNSIGNFRENNNCSISL